MPREERGPSQDPGSDASPAAYGSGMDVEYPGFGVIVIDGERFEHDVVFESGRVRPRDKEPSRTYRSRFGHTPLSADEDIPWSGPRLVVGTGASGRLPIMAEVQTEAEARGVELIVLPTSEACALLRSEDGADVSAVLHVTC